MDTAGMYIDKISLCSKMCVLSKIHDVHILVISVVSVL